MIRTLIIITWTALGGAGLGYMLNDLLGFWGFVLSLPIIAAGGSATGLSMADATTRRREQEGRL